MLHTLPTYFDVKAHRNKSIIHSGKLPIYIRYQYLLEEVSKRFHIEITKLEELYASSPSLNDMAKGNLNKYREILDEIHRYWQLDFVEIKFKLLPNPEIFQLYKTKNELVTILAKGLGLDPNALECYLEKNTIYHVIKCIGEWQVHASYAPENTPIKVESFECTEPKSIKFEILTLKILHQACKDNHIKTEAALTHALGADPKLYLHTINAVCDYFNIPDIAAFLNLEIDDAETIMKQVYNTPLQEMHPWDEFLNCLRHKVLTSLPRNLNVITFKQLLNIVQSGLYLNPILIAEYFHGCPSTFFITYFQNAPVWSQFGITEFNDLYLLPIETQNQLAAFSDATLAQLNIKLFYYKYAPTSQQREQILALASSWATLTLEGLNTLVLTGISMQAITYTYGEYPEAFLITIEKILNIFGFTNLDEFETIKDSQIIYKQPLGHLITWASDMHCNIDLYLRKKFEPDIYTFTVGDLLKVISSELPITPQKLALYLNSSHNETRYYFDHYFKQPFFAAYGIHSYYDLYQVPRNILLPFANVPVYQLIAAMRADKQEKRCALSQKKLLPPGPGVRILNIAPQKGRPVAPISMFTSCSSPRDTASLAPEPQAPAKKPR